VPLYADVLYNIRVASEFSCRFTAHFNIKIYQKIIMESTTDEIIMSLVVIALLIIESFQTLLSLFNKGIFIDSRTLLLKKSNKELKGMLVGVKKISNLNKEQLVDLILAAS